MKLSSAGNFSSKNAEKLFSTVVRMTQPKHHPSIQDSIFLAWNMNGLIQVICSSLRLSWMGQRYKIDVVPPGLREGHVPEGKGMFSSQNKKGLLSRPQNSTENSTTSRLKTGSNWPMWSSCPSCFYLLSGYPSCRPAGLISKANAVLSWHTRTHPYHGPLTFCCLCPVWVSTVCYIFCFFAVVVAAVAF